MDFIKAVKMVKSQQGITDVFFAALCDYGAFNDEEHWVRNIAKTVCDQGYHKQMKNLSVSDRQWTIQVNNMIYSLNNHYGFQPDMASEVLRMMALGLGLVRPSYDWNREFGFGATSSPQTVLHGAKPSICPHCRKAYYKLYSKYCDYCGRER